MVDEPPNQKQIPESAVKQEEGKAAEGDSLAKKESKKLKNANYDARVKDGPKKIKLLHYSLYQCGVTFIFILACAAVTYLGWLSALMLWAYMDYVMSEPERLGVFLGEVWKVLTGASVIVFVQLLGWTVKRKADEFRGSESEEE